VADGPPVVGKFLQVRRLGCGLQSAGCTVRFEKISDAGERYVVPRNEERCAACG